MRFNEVWAILSALLFGAVLVSYFFWLYWELFLVWDYLDFLAEEALPFLDVEGAFLVVDLAGVALAGDLLYAFLEVEFASR